MIFKQGVKKAYGAKFRTYRIFFYCSAALFLAGLLAEAILLPKLFVFIIC
jgi:hypothetical protein